MNPSWCAAAAMAFSLIAQGAGQAQSVHRVADVWWNPDKQNAYMRQVCGSAQTAPDLDECQYVAESLIDNLRDCIRQRSPYAGICANLLPQAQSQLEQVNRNPVLLEHRQDQWDAQKDANIRSLCASRNGGYFAGAYTSCVYSYGVTP